MALNGFNWREVAERCQDMAWASHSMAERQTDLPKNECAAMLWLKSATEW